MDWNCICTHISSSKSLNSLSKRLNGKGIYFFKVRGYFKSFEGRHFTALPFFLCQCLFMVMAATAATNKTKSRNKNVTFIGMGTLKSEFTHKPTVSMSLSRDYDILPSLVSVRSEDFFYWFLIHKTEKHI